MAVSFAPEQLLGLARDEVRRRLGKANVTGPESDSFFKAGVFVNYDADGRAVKVSVGPFVTGDVFAGKVLGVGLGDTRADCEAAWGEPVRVRPRAKRFPYMHVFWHHGGYVVEAEIWKWDGRDKGSKGFGEYKADTVKEIIVSLPPVKKKRTKPARKN